MNFNFLISKLFFFNFKAESVGSGREIVECSGGERCARSERTNRGASVSHDSVERRFTSKRSIGFYDSIFVLYIKTWYKCGTVRWKWVLPPRIQSKMVNNLSTTSLELN